MWGSEMYSFLIRDKKGNPYSVKASTYDKACQSVGLNPSSCMGEWMDTTEIDRTKCWKPCHGAEVVTVKNTVTPKLRKSKSVVTLKAKTVQCDKTLYCLFCGKSLDAERSTKRYCNDYCRVNFNRQKNKITQGVLL